MSLTWTHVDLVCELTQTKKRKIPVDSFRIRKYFDIRMEKIKLRVSALE